jgi:hypothetical protein
VADLKLHGLLNLKGQLDLKGRDGGKVKVGENEVLVEVSKGDALTSQGQGAPVILPPPPAAPTHRNEWLDLQVL